DGLLVFGLAVGVGDYAAAAPATDLAVLGQQATDGDRAVHFAAHIQVQQRAAIQRAARRLQFVDDLHGTYLRCAGNRATGEAAGDQVQSVFICSQLASDGADQVMHVGV